MPSTGKRAVGERVRVSDAFDLRMGKTPSRKNPLYWRDGSHDWVSIADLGSFGKYVGETKEQINDLAIRESGIKPAPADTVLMSFKLSLGKTSITTVPVYTNEAIMAFVDKGTYPVCLDFIYHQCRSKDWAVGTNAAVKGKTLNKGSLERATIYLPDLDKQKEIAARFDSIDGQIAKAENQVEWLGALVKSRFIEMFGDPIGNPMGWKTASLGESCAIVTGNTPSREHPEYYGNFIEWAKTDNIVDRRIMPAVEGLSELGASKARVAPAGSVLMACIAGSVNSIGKVGLLDRDAAFNQQINAIIPGAGYDSRYLTAMLGMSKEYFCSDINKQLKAILSKSALSAKIFPLPPLALQREFAEFVAHVDHLESLARQSIAKLQLLYDSLAQDYFGTPEA